MDKTVVITGAASSNGIGFNTAEHFAEKGWGVVILDLDSAASAERAQELAYKYGGSTYGIGADVSQETSVKQAGNAVLSRIEAGHLPPLGAVINIAGITSPVPFLETDLALWEKVMAVNATGTYVVTKAFLPLLLEAGWGRIVNMSSVSAQRGGGVFGKVPYSSAKAAVLGFTKALARELQDSGVTVNAVAPGAVDTDIRVGSTEEMEASIAAAIPLGRTATKDEISHCIYFLASDQASYLTGTTLDINGGSHMH